MTVGRALAGQELVTVLLAKVWNVDPSQGICRFDAQDGA